MAQQPFSWQRSALLLLTLTFGCGDAGTPAAPDADGSGVTFSAQAGSLRDSGIDRTDTHFAFYLTTTVSTGEESISISSLESDASAETRYYETGYEPDGDLRFNIYRDPSTDPDIPDPPALVRAVENWVYFYDQSGTLTNSDRFDHLMAAAGLPGGDLVDATTEGSLYYGGGGGGIKEPIYIESFPRGGAGPQSRKVSDEVMEIVVRTPEGIQALGMSAGSRTETIRRYRKRIVSETDGHGAVTNGQGHRWLLEEIDQTSWLPGRTGEHQLRTRSRYSYVTHHINAGKDRQRRQRLNERLASDALYASSQPPAESDAPAEDVRLASVDGINLCERGAGSHVQTIESGGAGIVWQHGFCDGAETWLGMRPKIAQTHYVGLSQAYSLNSDAYIRTQVAELASRLAAQPARGNVVVGHSQGGLVARRLGQRHPDLVGTVITIGTPHKGARIASAGPAWVADALTDATGEICFGDLLCPLYAEVFEKVTAGFLTWGAGELIPAAGDDRPGSPFLDSLNSAYEPFRRASIHVSVLKRWSLFRSMGDKDSPRERLLTESPLSGRDYVRNVEMAYRAGWLLQDIARALRWRAYAYGNGWGCHQSGYHAHWEPCYDPYGYKYHWYASSYWMSIASVMEWIGGRITGTLNFMNRTWNDITAGSDRTDGFVQYSSQIYPTTPGASYPGQYPILGGEEAHSGETASVPVMQKLRLALDQAQFPRN